MCRFLEAGRSAWRRPMLWLPLVTWALLTLALHWLLPARPIVSFDCAQADKQEHKLSPVAISADGNTVITTEGDYRQTLRFWDVPRGQLLGKLETTGLEPFHHNPLSPNDRWLGLTNRNEQVPWIEFCDATTHKVAHTFPSNEAVFAAQGDRIAYREDSVRLLDLASGDTRELSKAPGKLQCFSPDGRYLACLNDKFITVLDAATGLNVTTLAAADDGTHFLGDVQFGPDGESIAWHAGRAVVIMDMAGKNRCVIEKAYIVGWLPSGHVVTSEQQHVMQHTHHVEIWDWRENRKIASWELPAEFHLAVGNMKTWAAPPETFIASSRDGRHVLFAGYVYDRAPAPWLAKLREWCKLPTKISLHLEVFLLDGATLAVRDHWQIPAEPFRDVLLQFSDNGQRVIFTDGYVVEQWSVPSRSWLKSSMWASGVTLVLLAIVFLWRLCRRRGAKKIAATAALLVSFGIASPAWCSGDAAFFESKIAPILKKHCLTCHNPDKSRGGLDLSTRESAFVGGDKAPALVAGASAKSLLVQMIKGPKPKMPQKGETLSDAEVELIVQWIDSGAAWPKGLTLVEQPKQKGAWWSLEPIARPPVPLVKNKAWAKNEIDLYILAMLENKGLTPSTEADPVTLIRRMTFDLHGLPPTPEEVDAFVKDWHDPRSTPQAALERLVDRLLASPRYGERWARLWLDLIHYADTHGYDKDKRRLWAWLFRDWVIRAFNVDMPYRRFVRAQIAGDVLFPGDPDGVIATGFVVAGPWDFVGHVELREGTVDKEKTRVLDRDDMVANTMSTFCSLTVHCARCHDHKFDPISLKEYYQLQAVFAGVERGERPVASKDTQALRAEFEQKRKQTAAKRDGLLQKMASVSSPELVILDERVTSIRKQLQAIPFALADKKSPTNGYHSAIEKTADKTKWVQIDLGKSMPLEAVRLHSARPTDFADTPGFGFPVRYKVTVSDDENFAKATTLLDQTLNDVVNPGDQPIAIATDVRARYVRVTATRLWKRTNDYVFALAELQVYSGGKNVALGAKVTALDSIEAGRWSAKHLVDDFTSRHRLTNAGDRLALELDLNRLEIERRKLMEMLVNRDTRSELVHLTKELESLDAQLASLQDSLKVYAVTPIKARPIHVLKRGDVERKEDLVQARGLSLLKGLEHHFDSVKTDAEGARRAALANWIADDANVLTWRTIVNRIWQYHFGKGLVDTPSDFGRNGSRPTHPELLDWLASEFRDADSFKKLHRKILLSAAYRQASMHDAANAKRDTDNRYLWRQNRQRLDAESVRDSVLAVSGKLDFKMYGPGYDLFRFKDDHSPIYDHLDVNFINRPESWRRTVYRFVVRSVPNPFLETLDCADPNINVPVRNTTMTALQALTLLNNPFMVKQAEFFAERIQKQEKTVAAKVDAAYRLAFARMPSPQEREALCAYVETHGLANACRIMFNANEFLFVD